MSEDYAEGIIRRAQAMGMAGGVSVEVAVETVGEIQGLVLGQVKALGADVGSAYCEACGRGRVMKPSEVKVLIGALDECARLIEFCKGLPESRREVVGNDVLSLLNDEQLEVVRGWIAGVRDGE